MVKISVIVPVYNCKEYIEESISSILNHTFTDFEIVCIDDGSTDDSLKILNKLASEDSRLKVYSQENQGASVARNNALKKVSGDYVYFFDADDSILEDCLEKVYDNAVSNDSDMVIFDFDIYEGNQFIKHSRIDIGKKFKDADFSDFTFNYKDYRLLPFKSPFAPWFKFYKKEFLDKHDSLKFPTGLNHNDLPFHSMTILKASKISFLGEHLYHYRTDNPNSISNTRLKRYKDIFCILQIVGDFLKSEGLLDELQKEFDYLKLDQITYQINGRSNEYFDLAKKELSKIDLNNDYVSKNVLLKVKAILDSNSIEEYKYKMRIKGLENQNSKLYKQIEELENQKNNLMNALKEIDAENEAMVTSTSWRVTRPFRFRKKKIVKNFLGFFP